MDQELFNAAYDEILYAVKDGYYSLEEKNDFYYPNYSEICEWLGVPDLQDGGVYEQAIHAAALAVLSDLERGIVLHYKLASY
jgi:hypothetical protein